MIEAGEPSPDRQPGLDPPAPSPDTPYRYEFQFDEAMAMAAARLIKSEHGHLHAWFIVGMFSLVTLAALAFTRLWIALWMFPLYALALWYASRQTRLVPRIIRERLCLQCGYRLLEIPTDEHGRGTCPECGRAFNVAEYVRPPKRLYRVE